MASLKKYLAPFILLASLSACVSNQKLDDGDSKFGGEYKVTPLNDSIFYISVRTNPGPAVVARYDLAKNMFFERVSIVCKGKKAGVRKAKFRQLDYIKIRPLVVIKMGGYAVCFDGGLSDAQIEDAIANHEK